MHEYSLVDGLVRRVEEEVRRRSALTVHGVKVAIGELAGVDPQLFRTAYETFRAGTVCEKAALELRLFPACYRCASCGRVFEKGEKLRCAACDRPAVLDPDSDALLLEAIDLEVP